MTALTNVSKAISASSTEGDLKTFLLNQYNYLAGLFGTDGVKATAKSTLGIADGVTSLNGNSGAITAAQVAAAATAGYGYTPANGANYATAGHTHSNIPVVAAQAIGSFMICSTDTYSVAAGADISGTYLRGRPLEANSDWGSANVGSAVSLSGTWRNMQGSQMQARRNVGLFQRVA